MPYLLVDESDSVATLTINDPDKRNAINLDMCAEIIETMDRLESDETVRAIVVTGAPPAFCAGADLDDLLAARERDNISEIYSGFLRIAHSTLPTVAAVNGPAVGAGMNMALACDVILAGASARFDSRFLAIGIHPGGGHTWRLRNRTDEQTMRAMVLFGEVLDGQAAADVGLAWKCVPDGELRAAAHDMASRGARYPRSLVASAKTAMADLGSVSSSHGAVTHELEPQLASMDSAEFTALVSNLKAKISKR